MYRSTLQPQNISGLFVDAIYLTEPVCNLNGNLVDVAGPKVAEGLEGKGKSDRIVRAERPV